MYVTFNGTDNKCALLLYLGHIHLAFDLFGYGLHDLCSEDELRKENFAHTELVAQLFHAGTVALGK